MKRILGADHVTRHPGVDAHDVGTGGLGDEVEPVLEIRHRQGDGLVECVGQLLKQGLSTGHQACVGVGVATESGHLPAEGVVVVDPVHETGPFEAVQQAECGGA